MLFKIILSGLLLSIGLAYGAGKVSVKEGVWDDGTKIQWACKPGTEGAVFVQILQPNGNTYRGELDCGTSV